MRPRAKVTIESLQEVVYEKSIGTKMNDLDLCLEVVSRSRQLTIALHLILNISETVRDRGLVPKNYQQEMAYGLSNGHVTDDVKLITPIRLERNISKTILATRDFRFGTQLCMGNAERAHK